MGLLVTSATSAARPSLKSSRIVAALALRVGLRGAGARQVGVDVGQRLAADGHVVGAGEQAGAQPVALARGVGVGQLGAQVGDLLRQSLGRILGHAALGGRLLLEVERGDLIGAARGEPGGRGW